MSQIMQIIYERLPKAQPQPAPAEVWIVWNIEAGRKVITAITLTRDDALRIYNLIKPGALMYSKCVTTADNWLADRKSRLLQSALSKLTPAEREALEGAMKEGAKL